MPNDFTWLNPPPAWTSVAGRLIVRTGERTDFWRDTHYGFTRDTGHAWLTPVAGDFTAIVRFSAEYETLYDQAGVMLRHDAETWIKAGIEYTDGLMHFSTVVTGPRSDWSVIPLPEATPANTIGVRLSRHGDAVRVDYALEGKGWRMARLAPFTPLPARVGPMACSPERGGFCVQFSTTDVGPAISRNLHES